MDIVSFILAVSQNVLRINIFFNSDWLKVDAWKPDLWTTFFPTWLTPNGYPLP